MKELENLPINFQKKVTHNCSCPCNPHTIETTVMYNLRLDLCEMVSIEGKRTRTYRLYYMPDRSIVSNAPVIGEHLGMGEVDLQKLADELLDLIK